MATQAPEHPWAEYVKLMTAIDSLESRDEKKRKAVDAWTKCFGGQSERLMEAVMHAQTCDQCVQACNAYDRLAS